MVQDITLADIMIRHVASIGQDERITTAAKIMAVKNIGSILVTDHEDLLGILTEKDFLKKVISEGCDPNKVLVRDVMTSGVKTALPESSLFDAHRTMKEGHFRRLPVVDENNKIIGIVTETDVSDALNSYAHQIQPKVEDLSSINEKHVKHVLHKHYKLEPKRSYMIVEPKPHAIFDVFLSSLSQDFAGIAVTRSNPELIKKEYGFEETLFLWLTNLNVSDAIKPTELEKLAFTITSFINNAEKSVILLDGVEYLINYTSFKEVLHLVQSIVDKVSLSSAVLLLSLDPETIERKEFKLLERSLVPFTP